MQRQWIGLSLTGDQVTVEPLQSRPPYLQSIDIEAGFMKRGYEIAEAFSADDMAQNFLRAYRDVIFTVGQWLVFEFHGQNLKLQVVGLQTVDLPNAPPSQQGSASGVLMEKTDVTFIKAADSTLKLKSSAKKRVLLFALRIQENLTLS
jgi:vesicle-fusing ATPase